MISFEMQLSGLCNVNTNYVITESEVFTAKSQTEAGLRFCWNNLTVKVIKLFIIWLTERF